jgi:hypothetical protein
MRITFGESVSNIDAYRSAIVLELRDAEKLAQQVLRMVERRKERDAARIARQTPDAPET